MNWMNSRFAQWEVEGSIRERIQDALHEAEQGRLVQSTRKPGVAHIFSLRPRRVRGKLKRLASHAEASPQITWFSTAGTPEDSTSLAHTP